MFYEISSVIQFLATISCQAVIPVVYEINGCGMQTDGEVTVNEFYFIAKEKK